MQTLFIFYGAVAVILLFLFLLEAHFGMFDGLSILQAWLKATGMDTMPDQFVSIL